LVVQVPPQSTSVSVPFSVPSVQVGAWQIFDLHTSLAQSAFITHPAPAAHAGHEPPPQSTPVSAPFLILSVHPGTVHTWLAHRFV
jgi:hypothetical protein